MTRRPVSFLSRTLLKVISSSAVLVAVIGLRVALAIEWDEIEPGERAALEAIYLALDGPNWGTDENLDWFHPVTHDTDNSFAAVKVGLSSDNPDFFTVTELDLSESRFLINGLALKRNVALKGPIPPELGLLRNLRELRILAGHNDDDLHGPIPETLRELTQLEVLQLDGNLSGEIPQWISGFPKLEDLTLAGAFEGDLPVSLFELPNLRHLRITANRLIPRQLDQLRNLETLIIEGGAATSFEAGVNFGNLSKISLLSINNTGLQEIPETVGAMESLSSLALVRNKLSRLPDLSQLPKLASLNLIDNELSDISPLGPLAASPSFILVHLTSNRLDLSEGSSASEVIAALESAGKRVNIGRQKDGPSISGTVLEDTDGSGGFSNGDTGISGVTVQLFEDEGGGQPAGLPLREAVTKADGGYVFMDVSPGRYVIVERNKPGSDSVSDSAAPLTDDRIPVVVSAGDSLSGNDFLDRKTDLTITMHRVEASGLSGDSINLGHNDLFGVDHPLSPSEQPESLEGQPAIEGGLVADGVTPLLFRIEIDAEAISEGLPQEYNARLQIISGGSLRADPIRPVRLYKLRNGNWGPTNAMELRTDARQGYAYLIPIKPEEVLLDEGSSALTARIEVSFRSNDVPDAGKVFTIRKPPIFLVSPSSSRWGKDFLSVLERGRGRDFVVSLADGPTQSVAMGNMLRDWAVTRPDIVSQGVGGTPVYLSSWRQPPRGFVPFRAEQNLYRGWYGRAVMIGMPHRGSRLAHYVNAVNARTKDLKDAPLAGLIPEVFAEASGIDAGNIGAAGGDRVLAFNLLPDGGLTRLFSEGTYDEQTKVHLVATEVDPQSPGLRLMGLAPSPPPPPLTPLADARAAAVFPSGSDGFVGVDNALAASPPFDGKSRVLFSAAKVSHRDPRYFRTPQTQLTSAALAGHVLAVLDSDPSEGRFQSLASIRKQLVPFTSGELDKIDQAAETLAARIIEIESLTPRAGKGNDDGEGRFTFNYRISPPLDEPVSGEVVWVAEVYGANGVTTEGVAIKPVEGEPETVVVEVDAGVIGDVVLYAAYTSEKETLVFGSPVSVFSAVPSDAAVTGIEIAPDEAEVFQDTQIRPEIWVLYSDGSRVRRYPGVGELTASSSDAAVVDASDPLLWFAKSTGPANVTVTLDGMQAASSLTVIDPEAPGLVDSDGDGVVDFLEEAFVMDKDTPDAEKLPSVVRIDEGGEHFAGIAMTVPAGGNANARNEFEAGQFVYVMEISEDLETWSDGGGAVEVGVPQPAGEGRDLVVIRYSGNLTTSGDRIFMRIHVRPKG